MLFLFSEAESFELQFCCQDSFCAEESSRYVKNYNSEDCHVCDSSNCS